MNELVRVKRGFVELLCWPKLWEHFFIVFFIALLGWNIYTARKFGKTFIIIL